MPGEDASVLAGRVIGLDADPDEVRRIAGLSGGMPRFSKRSNEFLSGRTSQNKVVVFPRGKNIPGEYVNVMIERTTSATLIGKMI
jgi:hypothetical protein